MDDALPQSPACSFITTPSSGYTRLRLGHSMSTFIDLYHIYSPRQVASSGKGPYLREPIFLGTLSKMVCVCVCVSDSEYPRPPHPPQFISDPLPQSSPRPLFTWLLLPGVLLTLTSICPNSSHPARLGSKAASSKKLSHHSIITTTLCPPFSTTFCHWLAFN